MVKHDTVNIYAPAWFKATWKKFLEICERDGVSASHLIRVWVDGYVKRKDPGNPQRPLTAYVPGHEDALALNLPEILSKLELYASSQRNELDWSIINDELKPYVHGAARMRATDNIIRELKKRGIKVWR
ncbi:hypothetical protein ES703_111119 [subsurface metagenome]